MKTNSPSWRPGFSAGKAPFEPAYSVLNRLFEKNDLSTARLLHLAGSYGFTQRWAALFLCRAAIERGERALYLNLNYPLTAHDLQIAGLGSHFNPLLPDDPAMPFRLRPVSSGLRVERALEELSQEDAAERGPLCVVVDSVEEAFERRGKMLSPRAAEGASARLAQWLREFPLLCQKSGITMWLCHSASEGQGRFEEGRTPREMWALQGLGRNGGWSGIEGKEVVSKKETSMPKSVPLSPFGERVWPLLFGLESQSLDETDAPALYGLELDVPCITAPFFAHNEGHFRVPGQLWKGSERLGPPLWLSLCGLGGAQSPDLHIAQSLQKELAPRPTRHLGPKPNGKPM